MPATPSGNFLIKLYDEEITYFWLRDNNYLNNFRYQIYELVKTVNQEYWDKYFQMSFMILKENNWKLLKFS